MQKPYSNKIRGNGSCQVAALLRYVHKVSFQMRLKSIKQLAKIYC